MGKSFWGSLFGERAERGSLAEGTRARRNPERSWHPSVSAGCEFSHQKHIPGENDGMEKLSPLPSRHGTDEFSIQAPARARKNQTEMSNTKRIIRTINDDPYGINDDPVHTPSLRSLRAQGKQNLDGNSSRVVSETMTFHPPERILRSPKQKARVTELV